MGKKTYSKKTYFAERRINVLALCAGIGGIERGLKAATNDAARIVAICENDAYCAAVLRARMQDGHIDDCPIWSDVKTFDSAAWRGCVDIITAGYPCTPFSTAGRRKGANDARHLWPYIFKHVQNIRPAVLFCENVPGHLSLGFEQVVQDLSAMGYFVEAGIFSAAEIGAPHLRKRLFFIAYADSTTLREQFGRAEQRKGEKPAVKFKCVGGQEAMADAASSRCRKRPSFKSRTIWNKTRGAKFKRRGHDVANAYNIRCEQGRPKTAFFSAGYGFDCFCHLNCDNNRAVERRLGKPIDGFPRTMDSHPWGPGWEDDVPRVVTGQANRIDRLRALGNAVVPGVAALAWTTLVHQALSCDIIPNAQTKNAAYRRH